MPPTVEPLRYRVLEAIQTKLRGINGGPNYHNTVKSSSVVLDPSVNIITIPTTECPYFMVEPTPEGSKFYMPSLRMREEFQVVVTARADAPTGTDRSVKTLTWERLIADIEKAIMQDFTLGGLAVDVRIGTATPAFDLGAITTIIVVQPMTVRLIRTYGSPQGDS